MRVAVATVPAAVIGLERELSGHMAGIRTPLATHGHRR